LYHSIHDLQCSEALQGSCAGLTEDALTTRKGPKRLEKGIAKAATASDKATMKKLQRELNSTRKMLKQLQQQLNGIQRGTAAWDSKLNFSMNKYQR